MRILNSPFEIGIPLAARAAASVSAVATHTDGTYDEATIEATIGTIDGEPSISSFPIHLRLHNHLSIIDAFSSMIPVFASSSAIS